MRYPIVIDFETKKAFREVSGPAELGISVAGVYDFKDNSLKAYEEHELKDMFPVFENASLIVGFNIDHFDLPVLQPYYAGDITQFRTFDIIKDVKEKLGRRLRLDNLVKATLDEGKSGHGLQAIAYYREGKMEELKKYCLDDVRLTKELFEFGAKNGYINYSSGMDKKEMRVRWSSYFEYNGEEDDVSLTLPF